MGNRHPLLELARRDPRAALAEVRRQKQQIEATLARDSLAEFVKAAWPQLHPGEDLIWGWHMQAICDHLQAVGLDLINARRDRSQKQRCKNLMINVPPRSLKTEITQIFFVSWIWLHAPWLKILCTSANEGVLYTASRLCRELVGSDWYRETFGVHWTISDDTDNVKRYDNTARGERWAKPIGGRFTGIGVDLMIIDDPHDTQEAQSEANRTRVLDKWDTAIRNRLNSAQHVRVCIMQRSHEADFAGHVLSKGGWEHVLIPHEFEIPEPGREACKCESCTRQRTDRAGTFLGWVDPRTTPGELMIEGFYNRAWVENEKRQLGPYNWAGQHQQRPAPLEGGMFKRAWFKFFDIADLPKMHSIVLSIDAQYKKEGSSETGMIVVGSAGHLRYVLDDWTAKRDYWETAADVWKIHEKWPQLDYILVEEASLGRAVVGELQRHKFPVPIQLILPKEAGGGTEGDKRSRAYSAVGEASRGEVLVAKAQPWTEAFLHQLCSFPNAANDDRVDALVQALTHMRGSRGAARWRAALSGVSPTHRL